ncbi:MAG: hypothetical protein JSS77_15895 [Acidobacteria bacterium]|nr:hypothetical protein [Acidobacteriota bacterium]
MLGLAASTEEFRTRCEVAEKNGVLSFADVLMEEVSEAMDAESAVELRAELIQVAAVAVKWIESLDKQDEENGRVTIHIDRGGPTPSFAEQEERDLKHKLTTIHAEFHDVVVPHFHHSIDSMLEHMDEPHAHKAEHRMYHMGQLASMINYWKQFSVSCVPAACWGAVWRKEGSFVAKVKGDAAWIAGKLHGNLQLYTVRDGQLVPRAPK